MPRPRKNVPLGLDQPPNIVTEPVKVARMTAEFKRRFNYARWHYETYDRMANVWSFNASLKELRKEVARGSDVGIGKLRNFEIIGAIQGVAEDRAKKRGQNEPITDANRREAMQLVAELLTPRQGQRRNVPLTNYVEGMMALLQEMSGKPVSAGYHTKSVYDPQPRDWMAKLIVDTAQAITPRITATKVIGLIIAAQKKYAGKPMSFGQFYPCYGATVTPS